MYIYVLFHSHVIFTLLYVCVWFIWRAKLNFKYQICCPTPYSPNDIQKREHTYSVLTIRRI